MTPLDIAQLRLYNQRIAGEKFKTPLEVVRHMGAMQAQDYLGAFWAVGLRMKKAEEKDIEKALDAGKIVRTWPMRGTLHFVAAEDARWMLQLMTPKVLVAYGQRHKRMGITPEMLEKSRTIVKNALKGGKALTRPELYALFEKNNIPTKEMRGLHILGRLAHDLLICFGPRKEKEQTFVLFDEWVPKSKPVSKEEALKRLAARYFTSHGPATIHDLMWWSGLPQKDLKIGIELAGATLRKEEVEGKTYWMAKHILKIKKNSDAHLLPPFDEYVVGYKDRSAVLEAAHAEHINPGLNGMLSSVIVIEGQIVGTWKRAFKKDEVTLSLKPFRGLSAQDKSKIVVAAEAYSKFLNKKLHL
jgi:hypothetical protein